MPGNTTRARKENHDYSLYKMIRYEKLPETKYEPYLNAWKQRWEYQVYLNRATGEKKKRKGKE